MTNEELIVISAAKTHLEFAEESQNWGQAVSMYLRKVGHTTPQPWCAAFVSWVGWHALHDPLTGKSEWPVPLTAGCKAMGEWAAKAEVLEEAGAPGMLYLLHYPKLGRFGHVGFLLAPTGKENEWFVIDGNTNSDGSREGYKVCFRKRVIDPERNHRFVNWRKVLKIGGE